MKWFDHIFGGRKTMQAFMAAGLGAMAWFTIPMAVRSTYLFQFLLYWAACFGIYGWYNIKEHQLNGGQK